MLLPYFRFFVFAALSACAVGMAYAADAQGPSPTPTPRGSPTPKFTEQQMQEMIAKLQERIGKAADAVIGRIRIEEGNVYRSFSSFRKPERLNPATYTSKDDVNEWLQSLQRLKEQEDNLQKLYANAEVDLGNALMEQRINQGVADQVKKELLQSFPWDVIRKKDQFLREFISRINDLLNFYSNNWGSWKANSSTATPSFDDPKLATDFQRLKDKTNAAGSQVEDEYRELVR